MDTILIWLANNSGLLFSGIGTAIFIGLAGYFFRRKQTTESQTIHSGQNSINLQAGRDINLQEKRKKKDAEE